MADMLPEPSVAHEEQEKKGEYADGRIMLSEKDDEAIVKQVLAWWKESISGSKETRKLRTECHKMHDGDHWEKEDLARAKAQKRPALTFNMLLSIIAAVEGQERNNRQDMKYFGRGATGEDDATAEGWNRILKWVIDGNGGDFELSRQFKEMLISGEGWIVPDVDYLDDPEGTINLEFVDNDEMFDDPLSTHPVGTDSRYRMRVRMLSEDEGEALWPGKFSSSIKACGETSDTIQETDGRGYPDIYLSPDQPGIKRHDKSSDTWAVIQCWWWQIEPGYHVKNPETGLIDEMTHDEFELKRQERRQAQISALNSILNGGMPMQQPAPMGGPLAGNEPPVPPAMPAPMMPSSMIPPPLEATERPIKRVYEAFIVWDAVLECGPLKPAIKVFPAVPMRGIRRKSKNDFIGIIQPIIDVQRQHNVEQSAILQLVQLMPKNSWMAPKGAYHNKQDWESGVAQPGKMLEYNASRGKPEQIATPAIPRHLIDMAFSRPQSMREISGVNVELTGTRQGSDPGIVMEQRAKAAQTVLAPLFDNARRSKKILGKVLLAYMQEHLSPGRRVRILGADGLQEVIVSKDMLLGKYDMAVDESESTVNDRMATLNIMQTTLPQIMKAGVPIPPSFVDLLPIDTKIRDEWKNMIGWQLTINQQLPPPGWKFGDPIPAPPAPPGVAATPGAPPAPIA